MANKELIGKIKERLEAEKSSIEETLKTFATKDKNVPGDWDSRFPRFADGQEEAADEVEQYEALLPVEFSLEIKLKAINSALEKIKKGKYGRCEKCGKGIEEERLTVLPEARTCNACLRKK
ncbi:MAG: TraR/DksA C4-type zinc finger protein [bacterium]